MVCGKGVRVSLGIGSRIPPPVNIAPPRPKAPLEAKIDLLGRCGLIDDVPMPPAEVDAEVDARFEVLQAVVRSMRNARAEYQVAPGKRIPATVVATDAGALADLQAERAALCFLAKLDEGFELAAEAPTDVADDAVRLVVRDGVSVVLPMSGLVDVEKETERLTKQAAKLDKSLGQLEARLSSDFVNKAPAKVVDAAKAEAEEFRAQREQITARLAELAAMAPVSS